MSHLVKKLTFTATAVFVLLSMSAFAQNDSNLTLMARADKTAKPAKAAAAPAQHSAAKSSQNWMTHRFEISFQGGGVVGGNLGETDLGSCSSVTSTGADGCNVNQFLKHDDSGTAGVYPGLLGNLRSFQRFGGIQPGNGGVLGVRFGWNITPKWELEFVYNHASTGTSFTNQHTADIASANFFFRGFPGGNDRQFAVFGNGDGRPRGDQNMYLFNINRNFNSGRRVTTYIGAGLGAESWYGNPSFDIATITGRPDVARFSKKVPGQTGFAWDVAAGAKFHLTEHWGVRADVMNVMSFPEFTLQSRSVDVSGDVISTGAVVPISANVKQSAKFNQTLFTGGVFWAFGGGWDHPTSNAGTFDNENFWDRWEISFNFGGVHGNANGKQTSKCTPAASVAKGCMYWENGLSHDDFNGGIYPTRLTPSLPTYLATGGLKPGDGWTTGMRLSFALTPNWELAAIWNVTGASTAQTNKKTLDAAEQGFFSTDDQSNNPTQSYSYLGGADGHAKGNQSMFLFNINRTFHPTRRFVPYIGAGLGWESWNNNPRTDLFIDLSGAGGDPVVGQFTKSTHNSRGFAFDIAGGGKYYLSRHFGVRFDVMDVFSYQNFKTDFQSIDFSGLYGTPGALTQVSGQLKHDGNFSQLVSTGGVFYSFGKGGDWSDHDPLKSGTGAHAGRWELSFQTGGVVGGNFGSPDYGKCTADTTSNGLDGCNPNQPLKENTSGVYLGALGGMRDVQRFGGIEPGNGGLFGVRLGYNLNPHWQLEFVYNHASTSTALSNGNLIDPMVATYQDERFPFTGGNRLADYVNGDDGHPHGNQNMYLVNINRNFNVSGRVVPYIGVGLGGESWYANPKVNIFSTNENVDVLAEITKYPRASTGFAFNLQTGAKIYVTNSFGVRADFSNVMSWPGTTNRFQTIDVGGFQGVTGGLLPISGRTNQGGTFNQAIFSAGVFWSVGGRMDTHGMDKFSGDRDSMNDKWEIGWNFGGAHGASWGYANTSCTETITDGCDISQNLNHRRFGTPRDVLPGRLRETLPAFMGEGGVKPGDGWTTGFDLGFNFTPDWQLELQWNLLGTGTRFDNKYLLDAGQVGFYGQCDCYNPAAGNHRDYLYLAGADGNARGNQQQLLVNINRHFWSNRRIVPYIGAGLGAMIWNNNPRMLLLTNTTTSSGTKERIALFAKDVPSTTGFALDIKGGLKFYVSRHWGLKAEMLNVTSFQDFHPRFTTDDLSGEFGTPGAILPVSGRLNQSTKFNTTSGTAGFFFTF